MRNLEGSVRRLIRLLLSRAFGRGGDARLVPEQLPDRMPFVPAVSEVTALALDIADQKRRKLERLAPLLRADMAHYRNDRHYDFLSTELRTQFGIVDSDAVSSHEYDPFALRLIDAARVGWVLDCGAGKRGTYYENVVNFEIVDYDSTDVLGVGEVLPFADGVFDGVLSLNVLEHVKDPFRCASEIARVLKPGGKLYCVVPFLQPLHAFPHHYYNMTAQGLRNLFEPALIVDRQQVLASGLPIWTLCSLVRSWADGLTAEEKERFLQMKLERFMCNPVDLLNEPFVRQLSRTKNLELASTTALFASRA